MCLTCSVYLTLEDSTLTAAQLYTLAPMIQGDERDAELMRLYALGRDKLLPAKRHMILSGLAAFQREVTHDRHPTQRP